jgi:CRISPR-associated protein Csh1
MLSAIRDIGKWQIEEADKDKLNVLIREPNFRNGGKVISIKTNPDDKTFEGIELEDYDNLKKHQYLFRGGVTQGPNPTPAAIMPNAKKGKSEEETRDNLKKQLGKTFGGKILKWFEKYANRKTFSEAEKDFLENIENILSENQLAITQEIQPCITDIPKKEGKLLTIRIKNEDEWKYIGDFEIFRNSLKEIDAEKSTEISTNDKICSVCGFEKGTVSGSTGVFKFYTIDKPGFITGGFKEQRAWKNFPVCSDCKFELEEGRRFIEENLAYGFYGLKYLIIPKLLLTDIVSKPDIYGILVDSKKTISLKNRVKKTITADDNEILELLADERDVLTFSFLFMSKQQSAERISLLIEDVFPSRIRKIFYAKDVVDDIAGESFNFGKIRDFFAKSDDKKRNYDLNKYFLDIVDKVFRGVAIDFSFLAKFYMHRIRRDFISDNFFNPMVKNAIMSTLFFEKLGIITFEEVKDMDESIFKDIFVRYGSSLGKPEKRGVFLIGVLAQLLLNKQWSDRKAKPFMKHLKGLKMDEKDIKALLPKVQNKLEEYDSFDKGKRLIASEASKYLLEAGDGWKMSVDEINYYFSCGMNLTESIADIVYAK